MYLIIIFTLNISRCRMSDCPNIENSFKNLLYTALLKKSHHRAHTGNVDMNLSVKKEKKNSVSENRIIGNHVSEGLPVGVLVNILVLCGKILINVTLIFFLFSLYHFSLSTSIA